LQSPFFAQLLYFAPSRPPADIPLPGDGFSGAVGEDRRIRLDEFDFAGYYDIFENVEKSHIYV